MNNAIIMQNVIKTLENASIITACFVLILLFFILKNGTFLTQNLIKIYIKMHQIASIIQNFLGEHAPEPNSLCAADVIISI